MAKATDTETVEVTEEATPVTPKDLAEELGVDAKRIRAFLRQEFTRPGEAKNTSWFLSDEAAEAVRDRFTPSEDEDEEMEEDDSEEL